MTPDRLPPVDKDLMARAHTTAPRGHADCARHPASKARDTKPQVLTFCNATAVARNDDLLAFFAGAACGMPVLFMLAAFTTPR